MSDVLPLVSVGIPTYNRPELLRTALTSITAQTYRNLEILISDNASPDPEVAAVAAEFAHSDDRIRYVCQKSNIGPIANFAYVVEAAAGDYFMWAADDDLREPWYVDHCLHLLERFPGAAAATTEVQYVCDGVKLPAFAQGKGFYTYVRRDLELALIHAYKNNYDNLVYSLFRRKSLLLNGKCVWALSHNGTANEIPTILYCAANGGFIVSSCIGIYKMSSMATYLQAKWEEDGGRIPEASRLRTMRSLISVFRYHASAFREASNGLDLLPIDERLKRRVRRVIFRGIWRHYVQMLAGIKRPRYPAKPLASSPRLT